jgi:ribonucleoside-diphosphate reductase alpha chain
MCVEALDNTLELTVNPTRESKAYNNLFRVIGIGGLGFQDYLAKKNIAYDKSHEEARYLAERIAQVTHKTSINLAKTRGFYKAYKGSEFSKGKILGMTLEQRIKRVKETYKDEVTIEELIKHWKQIYRQMNKHGMRNGGLLAIAPNTSAATLQDTIASILPVYKPAFMEKDGDNNMLKIAPHFHKHQWYYKSYANCDQFKVMEIIAIFQEFTDQGISYETIHDLNLEGKDAKYFLNLIYKAWKSGIKALYYTRTITPDGSETEKKECLSCGG